jgi:integrase
MSRRRSDPSLSWLPPRVYLHRDKFVYQPKSGGKIILCASDSHKIDVLKRYEQEKGRIDSGVFFDNIISAFVKSSEFFTLSPRTKKDYISYLPAITGVFGKMRPNVIEAHHVRLFMDNLAITRGSAVKPANATANRHKACLQKVCSWAYQRGLMKKNPCVGVSKLSEKGRDRYITDTEYNSIYDCASAHCRVAMEISYLCMARIGDVMKLTLRDILDEGIFIEQGKTGKKQIKLWSERLREAVNNARNLPRKKGMATIFLLSKPDGSKYSVRAIQSQYRAATIKAGVIGCTFHDLKAKAVSDFEGTLAEKQNAAGHSTLAQTAKYDRKVKSVRSVK